MGSETDSAVASGSIYVFANLFANTAYTFLPILIAFSAAKAFGLKCLLG